MDASETIHHDFMDAYDIRRQNRKMELGFDYVVALIRYRDYLDFDGQGNLLPETRKPSVLDWSN